MEFKDYYKVLGVERTADQKTISQAFRKLARRHHPDVNQGNKASEQRFKEINEAYQVLNDPEKRAKYDQILDLRQHGGGWEDLLRQGAGRRGDGGTFTVYGSPGDLGEFSEFFQQLFGGLGGAGFGGPFGGLGPRREPDARRGGRAGTGAFTIEDLMEQSAGGAHSGGPHAGGGRGHDVEGTLEISMEEAYHGTRRQVAVPGGRGRAARTIEVTVPRGVRTGQRIRAAGQGQGGDLYLVVQVSSHPVFTRHDDDVSCEVAVPVWTAALGGEVEAPTLGGSVTMKVPAGTRDGRTFRLRGRGMPRVRGEGAGDGLVRVRLVLPEPLTPRDRELFEEMRRVHEAKV